DRERPALQAAQDVARADLAALVHREQETRADEQQTRAGGHQAAWRRWTPARARGRTERRASPAVLVPAARTSDPWVPLRQSSVMAVCAAAIHDCGTTSRTIRQAGTPPRHGRA